MNHRTENRSPRGFGRLCLSGTIIVLLLVEGAGAQGNTYEQTVLEIQEQIREENLNAASALLAEAERKYPLNGGLENLQGVVAIRQGKVAAAEKAFSAAIRDSPRLISAYLNLGRLYLQDTVDNPDATGKAMRVYLRALAIEPQNVEANYDSALLLLHSRKYGQSLEHLARLGPVGELSSKALAMTCVDNAGLGKMSEAKHNASVLAERPDLTEEDLLEVVPALLSAPGAQLADSLFSSVASHQSLSDAGLRMWGLAQEAENHLSVAQNTLEQAFAKGGSSTAILVDLARVAEARESYSEALGYLAHARDLDPRNASLPYRFGLICIKMKLLAESRKALSEAVRMDPQNADYNFALGTVTSFAVDPTEALPYLLKFHLLRPTDAIGTLALGTVYFRAKDFAAAKPYLQKAVKSPSTAADGYYYLARIERQEEHLDEAVRKLMQSEDLKPDQADVLAELGQIYVQMRKYHEAEKQLDRAATCDPDNFAAAYGLLQLYARTGDPRREDQAKRFEGIKQKNEQEIREAMRVLEVPPGVEPIR